MTPEQVLLLKQASEYLLVKKRNIAQHPNLFLSLHDPQDADSKSLVDDITAAVSREFDYTVEAVSIRELLTHLLNDPSATVVHCISVDSKRIERFRDVIKHVLWRRHRESLPARTLAEMLTTTQNTEMMPFRLADYGLFVPYIIKKHQHIRVHSFPHEPSYYRYRLCTAKTDTLPVPLSNFLNLLFENCPNHLYKANGFRASQQHFRLKTHIQHTRTHELIELAQQSKDFTQFKSRHENVEKYLLMNDPQSIACEIPVWAECAEFSDYPDVFHTEEPLTGHIDLLRYEDQHIAIWDYKPHAALEFKAATQVFLYALMLAARTGISLTHFRCGYFDEKDLYVFSPYEAKWMR